MADSIQSNLQLADSKRKLFADPLLWYVLGIGVLYGAVHNLLLITFPIFRRSMSADVESLGLMQAIVFGSALVLSLVSGWISLRLGLKRAVLLNLMLLAVVLGAIGTAPAFVFVLLLASIYGFCCAGLDIFSNALIARVFEARRQTVYFLSGVSIAVGYGFGAAAIGKWLRDTEHVDWGWRTCYWAIAVLVALFCAWGWLLPGLRTREISTNASSTVLAATQLKSIMTRHEIYVVGVSMFLHGLAQVGIVTWVGLLFQERHGIDTAQAAYLLSANAFGFFIGRMLLSWITARWRIPELLLLAFCSGLGTLTYLGTLIAPTYIIGLTLFFISGMVVCGNGPAMYSYVGSRFPGEDASAFGLVGVFAYIGSSVGPYVIGLIGTVLGLESGVWCIPVFSSLLFILASVSRLSERRRASAEPAPVLRVS